MTRNAWFMLLLSALPFAAFGADCDANWKDLRSSLLGFKELHFIGTIPGMPAGAIEMTVVEKPVDKGPEAIDVATKVELKGLPIKLPGMDNHTSHFTKSKFCQDVAKQDGEISLDGQSPGAVMAQVFRGKPKRVEKVKVPAGTFNADYYEVKYQTKKAGKGGNIQMWLTKIDGHRVPVRTVVAIAESPMPFDIQLKKAVKR